MASDGIHRNRHEPFRLRPIEYQYIGLRMRCTEEEETEKALANGLDKQC